MRRSKDIAVVLLSVLVPGCVGALGARDLQAERSDPAGSDAGATTLQALSSAGPESLPGSREICGNGVDDDGNGQVDEGCTCTPGISRPCYLGPPGTRHTGICEDGVQSCDAGGEFTTWGACLGSIVPSFEIADNGLDDNCDGRVDEPGAICVPSEAHETQCSDGHDNDCDGLEDCRDPDCQGTGSCPLTCAATETTCFGGVDDDCDGLIDCDDPDCAAAPACGPSPCAPGETPTYSQRHMGASYGPSSIEGGDGGALLPMTCEAGSCDPGMDSVETSPGTFVCVDRAPACAAGTFPTYDPSTKLVGLRAGVRLRRPLRVALRRRCRVRGATANMWRRRRPDVRLRVAFVGVPPDVSQRGLRPAHHRWHDRLRPVLMALSPAGRARIPPTRTPRPGPSDRPGARSLLLLPVSPASSFSPERRPVPL